MCHLLKLDTHRVDIIAGGDSFMQAVEAGPAPEQEGQGRQPPAGHPPLPYCSRPPQVRHFHKRSCWLNVTTLLSRRMAIHMGAGASVNPKAENSAKHHRVLQRTLHPLRSASSGWGQRLAATGRVHVEELGDAREHLLICRLYSTSEGSWSAPSILCMLSCGLNEQEEEGSREGGGHADSSLGTGAAH